MSTLCCVIFSSFIIPPYFSDESFIFLIEYQTMLAIYYSIVLLVIIKLYSSTKINICGIAVYLISDSALCSQIDEVHYIMSNS